MPKVSDAHREARRDEIIAAAIRAVAAKGFSRVSMADVIAESGLSVGAIYGHFAGKREILAAVAYRVMRRRRDEIDRAIAIGTPPTPGEAVEQLVRGLLREGIPPKALVQVWGEATVDPELTAIAEEAFGMLSGTLERALRAWFALHPQQASQGIDATVRRLIPLLIGFAQGFIVQYALLPTFDADTYLDGVRELLPH